MDELDQTQPSQEQLPSHLPEDFAAEASVAVAENPVILRAEAVRRSFPTGETQLEVLKGVDFALAEGDLASIVGSSGTGKSTLLHILGLLDKPNAGRLWYREREITSLSPEESAKLRNREFGFVFQFFHLLPEFNALENVVLPARMAHGGFEWLLNAKRLRERAAELLSMVGLKERMYHMPSQLSGGERQRVAMARALVNKPSVVFCDEPTGNLDSKTAGEVFELIRRLNQEEGQTFLIVTHDRHVADAANKRYEMRDGRFADALSGAGA